MNCMQDKNIVPSGKVPVAVVKDEPLEGSKKDESSNDSESNDDHVSAKFESV